MVAVPVTVYAPIIITSPGRDIVRVVHDTACSCRTNLTVLASGGSGAYKFEASTVLGASSDAASKQVFSVGATGSGTVITQSAGTRDLWVFDTLSTFNGAPLERSAASCARVGVVLTPLCLLCLVCCCCCYCAAAVLSVDAGAPSRLAFRSGVTEVAIGSAITLHAIAFDAAGNQFDVCTCMDDAADWSVVDADGSLALLPTQNRTLFAVRVRVAWRIAPTPQSVVCVS